MGKIKKFIDVEKLTVEQLQNYDDTVRVKMKQIVTNFFYIGSYLSYVKENNLYSLLGYKNFSQYAKIEFGISQNQAYKFVQVYNKFNSPVYSNFNYNCLVEMLSLDEKQLLLVDENTTVKEIRNIKKNAKNEKDQVNEVDLVEQNLVNDLDPINDDEPIKFDDNIVVQPYFNELQLKLIDFIIDNECGNIAEKYQGLFNKSVKLKKIFGKDFDILNELNNISSLIKGNFINN